MSCITVSEIIGPYLADRRARGELNPHTSRNIRSTLFSFSTTCGKRTVSRIGPSHIETWLATLAHCAPATRRIRLSAVRSMFRWAVRRGHCRRNPCDDIERIRLPRALPRGLATADVLRVLEACPDARATLIVTLMVQQGLRCVEVSRLNVGDIDRTYKTMRIVGKGHHERILPVMEETATALDRYLLDHPASAGPLIRSYTACQRPLQAASISKMVAGWMWAAGVKRAARDGVSAHAGRHTCATDMLRNGAHVRDVQSVLGHAQLATTEIYLPFIVDGLQSAMEGRHYGEGGGRCARADRQ